MFFLEKLSVYVEKNGRTSRRWLKIYWCVERWPLETLLSHMDPKTHRITSNSPTGG